MPESVPQTATASDGEPASEGVPQEEAAKAPEPKRVHWDGVVDSCPLINDLPPEVRGEICVLLRSGYALTTLARVCRLLQQAVKYEAAWRAACEANWPGPTRTLAEAGVITSFRRYYEQQLTAERHRARDHLRLEDVFWTACLSVGGRHVHSQTVNLSEWPEDGIVRLVPSDRSISLGKPVIMTIDGTPWEPEEPLRVSWTAVRRGDGKMAHLTHCEMTPDFCEMTEGPHLSKYRGATSQVQADRDGKCRFWTFSPLACEAPHTESSMPMEHPHCYPYLEVEVRRHGENLFLAELAIRFCPDDPEVDDEPTYPSRDWDWVESGLMDQVWR